MKNVISEKLSILNQSHILKYHSELSEADQEKLIKMCEAAWYRFASKQKLEEIATSFKGIEKAFAIQAGRELRVIVNSDSVDDDATYLLCKDISAKIEENLTYPGQIRVTVIRERRAVGFAK